MRFIFTILLMNLFSTMLYSQEDKKNFNRQLADSLQADDYGMKMYVLVLLKSGNSEGLAKQVQDSLFEGHMKNIMKLVEEGKLILSGPFMKNEKNYEGIFILNVKTIGEATDLLSSDPAISSQWLKAELYEWYGSAALPMYVKYHEGIKKKDF